MSEDDKPPSRQGRRKDGKPFKDDNVREDGSYAVSYTHLTLPTSDLV